MAECHLWCLEVFANAESVLQMWAASQRWGQFTPRFSPSGPSQRCWWCASRFSSLSLHGPPSQCCWECTHGSPSSLHVDGPSPLFPVLVYGTLGRVSPPKRSQSPPTTRRGPYVSPNCSPPPRLSPGAGTGLVRFHDVPLNSPALKNSMRRLKSGCLSFQWYLCPS